MAYIFNNADTNKNILQLTEIIEHKVIITIVAIGVITTKLMFYYQNSGGASIKLL